MTEMVSRGTCDDCGKVYRVPSATRTYSCKACGGTVRSAVEPPVRAAARRSPARGKGVDRTGSTTPREAGERTTPQRRRQRPLWIGPLVAVVALGGAGWLGLTLVRAGGEPDLRKVVLRFDDVWEEGAVKKLAGMFHPTGREAFRARLELVREGRGWEAGFPEIVASMTPERGALGWLEGQNSSGERDKRRSLHETDMGTLQGFWQFNPGTETWYLYDLKIPPPDVLPRIDEFDSAWPRSDAGALAQFFAPGSAEKMGALVERKAAELGWTGSYPRLTTRTVDPGTFNPVTFQFSGRIEATYDTPDGEMMVRWRLHEDSDAWCISGIKFP